jgi:large subunit ribosomal protein L24
MQRIRSGDTVVVIRGDDKGKRGKVSRVIPSRGQVVVEGVNSVKRHIRQTPQRPGGILEVEAPISVDKVMLVDPSDGKPTRVKYKIEDGKKVRVAKVSDAAIPVQQR